MATFTISMKCDNAAVQDETVPERGILLEVRRILGGLSRQFTKSDQFAFPDSGPLIDCNGNRVGLWTLAD